MTLEMKSDARVKEGHRRVGEEWWEKGAYEFKVVQNMPAHSRLALVTGMLDEQLLASC